MSIVITHTSVIMNKLTSKDKDVGSCSRNEISNKHVLLQELCNVLINDGKELIRRKHILAIEKWNLFSNE